MSSEEGSGSPMRDMAREEGERGTVMMIEALSQETFLLRALDPKEVFQLVRGRAGHHTERKLAELREEHSPEVVNGAVEGLLQALTDESETGGESPSSAAEKRSSDRRKVWKKIKELYRNLNLFKPPGGGVSRLKLPTGSKLRAKRLRRVSKKIKTKLSGLKGAKQKKGAAPEQTDAPETQASAEKKTQDGVVEVSKDDSSAEATCLRAIKLKAAGERLKRRTQARLSALMKPVKGRMSKRIHSGFKIRSSRKEQLRRHLAKVSCSRFPSLQAGKRSVSRIRASGAKMARQSCGKIISTKRKTHIPNVGSGQRSVSRTVKVQSPEEVVESVEEATSELEAVQTTEPKSGCADKIIAAGVTVLRKSREKVQNADLTSCLPMESGRRSLEKLKAAGTKLLKKRRRKVLSSAEDVESEEDADSDLEAEQTTEPKSGFVESGKRCADQIKAAGVTVLRKSREKVQNVDLTSCLPMESGRRSLEKLKAAGTKLLKKRRKVLSSAEDVESEEDTDSDLEAEQSTEPKSGCADKIIAAGVTVMRKSREKVQNADLTSCLPMESGRRSLEKLKAAGTKLLKKRRLKVISSAEDVESEEDADSELEAEQSTEPKSRFVESGKKRAANMKAAGAKILRKSLEKVQKAELTSCLPIESGKRFRAKIKAARAEMLQKCEKCGKVRFAKENVETEKMTDSQLREKAQLDKAELLKSTLKKSIFSMYLHILSETGFAEISDEFIFPIHKVLDLIWNEVKDETIQMDQTTIVKKLHLLVYKDLLKEWKKAALLLIHIPSGPMDDFIASTFVKHLTRPKKPSLFRRFLNLFHRSN